LTFDDGPTPEITTWVLKELDKYNAKATFFCIGKNADANRDIYEDILKRRHSIGNHTYNHLNGWKTKSSEYITNIQKANAVLKGMQAIFRPPYGKMTFFQSNKVRNLGLKIIGWDILSADFDQNNSNEKCLENIIRHSINGSIIVFHDSIKAEKRLKYVLPRILEYYSSKGFEFKRIVA
jgi:peptidoglycan/xylan/chitin deacetylase (PgdA/CDA1 family)